MGSVPKIFNLVQATNDAGVALFVDADGNKVESPPANLVTGYFPLFIDEGELTFDKSGRNLSPKQGVHYEKQEAGFSIVTWAGDGNVNSTVGHGLDGRPDFIMLKCRTSGYWWRVYHRYYGTNATSGVFMNENKVNMEKYFFRHQNGHSR